MTEKVKISDDLKKSLHKDKAREYEKEEKERLKLRPFLKNNTASTSFIRPKKDSDNIRTYKYEKPREFVYKTEDIQRNIDKTYEIGQRLDKEKPKWRLTGRKYKFIDKEIRNGKEVDTIRLAVEVQAGNDKFLMYESTGAGAPKHKKKGDWVPVIGFSPYGGAEGWFIKGTPRVFLPKTGAEIAELKKQNKPYTVEQLYDAWYRSKTFNEIAEYLKKNKEKVFSEEGVPSPEPEKQPLQPEKQAQPKPSEIVKPREIDTKTAYERLMRKKAGLKEKSFKKDENLNTIEERTPLSSSVKGANMAETAEKKSRLHEIYERIKEQRDTTKLPMAAAGSNPPRRPPGDSGSPPDNTPPDEKNEAWEEISSMSEAVRQGIRPPTQRESRIDTEKMRPGSERPTGKKKASGPLVIQPVGPRQEMQINRVCPECGSSPVLTIPEDPGKLYCPACGHRFSAKQKETAFSNIIHSDITVIFISTLAGLMIPVIFGSTFGLLGTALIGVGVIFLGLSKL